MRGLEHGISNGLAMMRTQTPSSCPISSDAARNSSAIIRSFFLHFRDRYTARGTQNRQPTKTTAPYKSTRARDMPHPTPNHPAMRTELSVLFRFTLRIAAWSSGSYVMMPIDRADRHDPAPFGRNEEADSVIKPPKWAALFTFPLPHPSPAPTAHR